MKSLAPRLRPPTPNPLQTNKRPGEIPAFLFLGFDVEQFTYFCSQRGFKTLREYRTSIIPYGAVWVCYLFMNL